ncbi:MAG: succinate dehydrogenase/fumarate reductase iron-sulfur subunit [Lachnospiraceae bacterium]|jgi:fumarate reductase (CoM/CoB) subunit B
MAKVYISRFDPCKDKEPHIECYDFDLYQGMSVLDVLNYIREEVDSTLIYDHCCRNGHCGLCAVMVNKKAALSCRRGAEDNMVIEPLRNFPVLRDLMFDREYYEKRKPALRLFLERSTGDAKDPERIDMGLFEHFKEASRCIECYSCVAQCPVFEKNPYEFSGPAAFVLEARHIFDCRDELNRELIMKSGGIDKCIGCGLCSEVCDNGVDPANIIKRCQAL